MGSRRFKPLIAAVLALTAVVFVRLVQVQVFEHEVWAREAVNLVRSSEVMPYRRGSILDRRGRVMVRDVEVYRVQFRYRDFRRGHPLGQVAHAWSSLELRPVSLGEAYDNLGAAAVELVQLTHAQLDAFAEEGQPISAGLLAVGPAVEGVDEYRLTRRADLRFYISRLLRMDRRELLDAVRSKDRYPSLLDYALSERPEFKGRADLDRDQRRELLLNDLLRRLEQSQIDLGRLAELLYDNDFDTLINQLEQWRREVEDSTAGELFREASGFSVGRLAQATASNHIDLDWLAVLLRWDRQRLDEWLLAARAQWREAFEEYHLKRLAVLVEVGDEGGVIPGGDGGLPHIVSSFWAERYLAEPGGPHPLEVFDELDSLFEIRIPRQLRAADRRVLPFEEPEVYFGPGATWPDLARLELWALNGVEPTAEEVAVRAAEWRGRNAEGRAVQWVVDRSRDVVHALEPRFQRVLAGHLDALSYGRRDRRLPLSPGRLDRAEERAQSVLKDRGSRPFELTEEQEYTLIHLVTRYPEAFAGFGVRETTKRELSSYVRAPDRQGIVDEGERVRYAEALLGEVRKPDLREMLEQRVREQELAALRHKGEVDYEAISSLVTEIRLVDEQLGSSGIEGLFEEELSGANGYYERQGMQELLGADSGEEFYSAPVDGKDLVLTLDLDLQRAAQETLAKPAESPNPKERDYAWLNRPTGAIVLARTNGDVLAAASYPTEDRPDPETGGSSSSSRDWGIDRTLRAPGFQPPGSVFKPFVAAWALEHCGLDPDVTMTCGAREQGPGAGYKSLRCHSEWGHGEIGLHRALVKSCNGYFAWLGEQLTEEAFHDLARAFGFGQPTGVRYEPDRGGLTEVTCSKHLLSNLNERRRRFAGNGLSVINATPMQIARAYAGLATGRLPEMRLVHSVGGEVLDRRSRPIGVSREVLAVVHEALADVTRVEEGSGHTALKEAELGFFLSAKTGSADLSTRSVVASDGKQRVRKHTWVAGWFPPEDPKVVLVVFVDDTLMTASKSSVWIARQFLQRPEIDALRKELGL